MAVIDTGLVLASITRVVRGTDWMRDTAAERAQREARVQDELQAHLEREGLVQESDVVLRTGMDEQTRMVLLSAECRARR